MFIFINVALLHYFPGNRISFLSDTIIRERLEIQNHKILYIHVKGISKN